MGLTLVEPLDEVEVNVPGVIAMLLAPVVTQLGVLLEPAVIVVGLAANELMVGALGAVTETVAADVAEPEVLVAVRV